MSALKKLLRDRRSLAGAAILGVMALAAVIAPVIAPADPIAQGDVIANRFLSPLESGGDGIVHWLGTDRYGRDILSRLIFGARISLSVGLLSVTVAIVLGVAIGVTAAAFGGAIERALMVLTDVFLALPRLVLLLTLVTIWDSSLLLVALVLGFTGWMSIARLVRAEVRSLLSRPFVDAARAGGISLNHLVWHHLIPNSVTPVFVAAALSVGNAIALEAGLSFLGLGIPHPAPSWGNMIAAGRDALVNAPWISVFPGLCVALAVIACNLLGDGARDALDPRSPTF